MPSQTPGSDLPPLPHDLAPEVRALACFLRDRFERLRISPREYARMRNWDAEAVHGFLGGQIPPQDFIDSLLGDAGPERSTGQVDSEHTESTGLREAALRTADSRKAEQERLERELSRVQRIILVAEARERELESKLTKEKAKFDSLLENYEELRRVQNSAALGQRQLEGYYPRLSQLDHERNEAQVEIKRLNGELSAERNARANAEEKRDELRAELDRARMEVALAGGSVAAFGHYRPRTLTILRSGRIWPLVAVGSSLAFYCTFYLGLVYHLLSGNQSTLKLLTISWMIFPAGVLAVISRIGRGEIKNFVRYLCAACLVATALFFIGASL